MPKLYEYFGLIFLFYSDDHDPMHLHVQHGDREGIIMLIIVEGKLVELRWRAKRGAEMLNAKEQRESEVFVRDEGRYRGQPSMSNTSASSPSASPAA
ncbi:MAG: DUF4160 domain-containing protein [Flavobacteriales bacterium]|nr:DUF4160 domain-containing protein [Flavobacteriales bacterium]